MSKMQLLEDAYQIIEKYTFSDNWRPGITDLYVYDLIVNMYAMKEDLEEVWSDTPDHVMQHIIDNNVLFSIEQGGEQLDDEVRMYLFHTGFITDSSDELTEEE